MVWRAGGRRRQRQWQWWRQQRRVQRREQRRERRRQRRQRGGPGGWQGGAQQGLERALVAGAGSHQAHGPYEQPHGGGAGDGRADDGVDGEARREGRGALTALSGEAAASERERITAAAQRESSGANAAARAHNVRGPGGGYASTARRPRSPSPPPSFPSSICILNSHTRRGVRFSINMRQFSTVRSADERISR
jgi:hypothetical protein